MARLRSLLRLPMGRGGIVSFLVWRIWIGLTLLLILSTLVFIGTALLPGDAATALLGRSATPQMLEQVRLRLGLDQSLLARYLNWLGAFLHGDLGVSLMDGRSVTESIAPRLGNTLILAAASAVVSVPLSVFLGIVSVRFRGGFIDRGIAVLTRAFVSLPEFFVGYVLIFVFSISLGWLASSATVFVNMSLADRALAMVLPCLTLTLAVTGHIATLVRAALLEVMGQPYIEMAVLKGVPPASLVWRHALPNALSPIIHVVLVNLAYLVAGVVVVEVVFVYPGLGQLMVDSVVNRDIPVVQVLCLFFASIYITLNLLADALSILTNPRLRAPK